MTTSDSTAIHQQPSHAPSNEPKARGGLWQFPAPILKRETIPVPDAGTPRNGLQGLARTRHLVYCLLCPPIRWITSTYKVRSAHEGKGSMRTLNRLVTSRLTRRQTLLGLATAASAPLLGGAWARPAVAQDAVTLTLVAYSTPREAYEAVIPLFQATPQGAGVQFETSFAGSGEQ